MITTLKKPAPEAETILLMLNPNKWGQCVDISFNWGKLIPLITLLNSFNWVFDEDEIQSLHFDKAINMEGSAQIIIGLDHTKV